MSSKGKGSGRAGVRIRGRKRNRGFASRKEVVICS